MTKKQRLTAILSLIESEEIGTQEELTERLNSLGHDVSQATISRDINTLNLIKAEGNQKKSKYVRPAEKCKTFSLEAIARFRQITKSIDYANNLIVVKTLSGNGAAVGNVIDEMNIREIMGTVAGDDTLLIVSRSASDAEKIVKTLRNI